MIGKASARAFQILILVVCGFYFFSLTPGANQPVTDFFSGPTHAHAASSSSSSGKTCSPACAACTQVCLDGACTSSGLKLCPDGRCINAQGSCTTPPCKLCVEYYDHQNGKCVPSGLKMCPDGQCVKSNLGCNIAQCDPACNWCTEQCVQYTFLGVDWWDCKTVNGAYECDDGSCLFDTDSRTCGSDCNPACAPCVEACQNNKCVPTYMKLCWDGQCVGSTSACQPTPKPTAPPRSSSSSSRSAPKSF